MDTKHDNDSHDRIELRSEKVRQLLGEIPPALVRWGTVIVILIFLALLAAILTVPSLIGFGKWTDIL